MANVSVYNMEGNEVGTLELNDAVFGVEVNEHLVHLAVVAQLANKRQGTLSCMTGSLMSPGLSSAARNLRTCFSFLCSLTLISKMCNNCKMYQVLVYFYTEHGIVQF